LPAAEGGRVNFDVLKFSWVGSAAAEASVMTIRTDLPYKTLMICGRRKNDYIGKRGPGLKHTSSYPDQGIPGSQYEVRDLPSGPPLPWPLNEKRWTVKCLLQFNPAVIERGLVRPLIRGRSLRQESSIYPSMKILLRIESQDHYGHAFSHRPGWPALCRSTQDPAEIMKTLRDALTAWRKTRSLRKRPKR